MKDKIKTIIKESIETNEKLLQGQLDNIQHATEAVIASLKKGKKILAFGNGGSAACAQHMVCEFVGRFRLERPPLRAISLTTNTSSLTAISNDYDFQESFSRQIQALGEKDDVAIGISTSGASKNVLAAVKKANSLGLKTICLAGGDGGDLAKIAKFSIIVPSKNTPRIQESHELIAHIICEIAEKALST